MQTWPMMKKHNFSILTMLITVMIKCHAKLRPSALLLPLSAVFHYLFQMHLLTVVSCLLCLAWLHWMFAVVTAIVINQSFPAHAELGTCRMSLVSPEQHVLCIPTRPTKFAVSSDKANKSIFPAVCAIFLQFIHCFLGGAGEGYARWQRKVDCKALNHQPSHRHLHL